MFTHASVLATDLDTSAAFYESIFGMERVPAPNFPGVEVVWLRCGDLTLHLFDRPIEPASYYHVGFHVDDFEAVYQAARDHELVSDFRGSGDRPTIYELPEGAVQLYLHDPAGNLVEVNYHDVDDLSSEIREAVVARAEQVPQTGEASHARLYTDGLREVLGAGQDRS